MYPPPRFWSFSLVLVLVASCASPVYYVKPREWNSPSVIDSIVASYRPALQGHRIFLDPGHGGDDRLNRGPRDEAIEADVNLRVALALRSYFTGAGAEVFMSRDRDTTVALPDRPLLALQDSAELFISLHHNATAASDPSTNYAAVYYHAREGSPEYHPANHDIARYIERDMSYAMRNASAPSSPTFDGTLSDFDIYPNSGFAVLRQNHIPAVLVEASFHTHPPEERRLAVEEFNRIEAWGIFLGVGKYFRAGIPTLALRSDSLVRIPRPVLLVEAQPATSLDRSSLRLYMDGREVAGRDTLASGIVAVALDRDLTSGMHQLSAWVRNRQGNYSWPFRRTVTAMLPAKELELVSSPTALPASPLAVARLIVRALDAHRRPVADGSPLHLLAKETAVDTVLTTLNGIATTYLAATGAPGNLTITAESGNARGHLLLPVHPSPLRYLTGRVVSDSGAPVQGALIALVKNGPVKALDTLDVTPPDGRYVGFAALPGFSLIRAERAGYFVKKEVVQPVEPVTVHDISLVPLADGKLFGKSYLIDARYGGAETGDVAGVERSSDVNLAVAHRLHQLLTALGADAILMRQADQLIPESERARRSTALPRGIYIRVDASSPAAKAGCEMYSNPTNRIISSALLAGLKSCTGLDTTTGTGSADQFYRDVASSTISLVIPSVTTGYYAALAAQRIDAIAWGIVSGLLNLEGYRSPSVARFVVRAANGSPLPNAPVLLDETVTRYTDVNGAVNFLGLERQGFVVTTPENPDALITRE